MKVLIDKVFDLKDFSGLIGDIKYISRNWNIYKITARPEYSAVEIHYYAGSIIATVVCCDDSGIPL